VLFVLRAPPSAAGELFSLDKTYHGWLYNAHFVSWCGAASKTTRAERRLYVQVTSLRVGYHPPGGAGGVSASGAETDDNTRYHTLLEKGNEIEAPSWGLAGAMPAIDRLAYFARELASFASYTLALFGQNEIVAGS
jgi:hypothetical protein